jgi:hypothetical protein
LGERVLQRPTKERDGDDDDDRYERDHDAVFNGSGAALLAAKTGRDVIEE